MYQLTITPGGEANLSGGAFSAATWNSAPAVCAGSSVTTVAFKAICFP